MKNKTVYLDNAASTAMPRPIIDLVADCMEQCHGNPSSVHGEGRKAKVMLEDSRRKVAGLLSAAPSEIYFTSGGTEANNAILWSCFRDLGIKSFITSRLEHPAVLKPLDFLKKNYGIRLEFAETDRLGHVDLDHLEKLIRQFDHALVSLMHANNEIGNLLPVKDVSAICKTSGALFHSDTVQTIGKYPVDLSAGHVDFAVASAHKFHGPKGSGFMYIRSGNPMHAFISGGNQERNMRAGTENVAGIAGLAAAMEWCYESLSQSHGKINELKSHLIESLQNEFPDVAFNGDAMGSSLYTIVNFSLPLAVDSAILLSRLDMEGICVSSGSACSSGSLKGSHVLSAIGADPAKPSLRVSLSRFNTRDDIDYFMMALRSLRRQLG